jgi:hypothetical protein
MRFKNAAIALIVGGITLLSGTSEAGTPALDAAISGWAARNQLPQYRYALSDLNGDEFPDAVVLVSDPMYCGSGGCTMVIFKGTASGGFDLVSHTTITREPIHVLAAASSGWRALSVLVSGGGAPVTQVLLRFDGERYPLNPSLQAPATAVDLQSAQRLQLQ